MNENEQIVQRLREKLNEGKSLLESMFDRRQAILWEAETESYVRALDPYGSAITSGSAYWLWDHAQWFRGNRPQNDEEEEAVFRKRVAALESLLLSEIRLAEPRDSEPPNERTDSRSEEAAESANSQIN